MDKRDIQDNEIIEIDVSRLFRAVMDRAWIVAVSTAVCAVLVFVWTYFFVTPMYTSAARFYVNNNSFSVGGTSLSITSGDLVTSRSLVDSYIVILTGETTLEDVMDYTGIEKSFDELRSMITAEAVNETEIFQVSVTSSDPIEAEIIADAITYILPRRIDNIVKGTSSMVVDVAKLPSSPSSPNYTKNTMIGFVLGFVLSVGMIVLWEYFDVTIRTEDDIAQICTHPILSSVPDMNSLGKNRSRYYYGYERIKNKEKRKEKSGSGSKSNMLIGSGISFSAAEGYRILRTKIQFSFVDDNDCRVIGVCSAISGEGKSLTASNLAYSLSKLDKKVILVDCDMHCPTLADKLGIRKKPGLSSYLTRQCCMTDLIQKCNLENCKDAFDVISAGQNPPNPVELLSSARMQKALDDLRREYDYVLLDLPPVCEVADAMAVANVMDGMLLVVRQNYCDRVVLSKAVRQFEFMDAKILGVIFNCTNEHEHRYGSGYYRRYHRYGHKYYTRGYASDYQYNRRPAEDSGSKQTV